MDKEKEKRIEESPPPQTAKNEPQSEINPNEEQMMRRQSAPRPTAESEAMRLYEMQKAKAMQAQGLMGNGAVNGMAALTQVIGAKEIAEADVILRKYKQGKANLEQKIVGNEEWYKLRHWDCMRKKDDDIEPASAWLLNGVMSRHADSMDNYPSPNALPREESDKAEAEMLSSIIPVILDQNDFEQTYSDVQYYKLKTGTGVYGVFWDNSKLNGLGDVAIRKIDMINLFWESGIMDIQKSRNVFHVELADNDILAQSYPQLIGKLSTPTLDVTKYVYDDTVDTTNKSIVVDWYYKKNVGGKNILHYCKYCNGVVLYATENDPDLAERGWYDHGEYPFVLEVMLPVEGTPAGIGQIDISKGTQEYIDRGNQAIMKNMLANAKPRYFIRDDGSVNEEEYADTTKEFVHVDGSLGQDSVIPIEGKPLSSIYVEVVHDKIDELKETTGNRDVSNGGTSGGVTAASGLAAQMEAGSKLSRDNNKASYRAFKKICLMIIELIRQFYDMPRCFRIMGEDGAMRFVQYSNQNLLPQMQGNDFGMDMGYRLPQFDIEVTAQKQSPYSKMAQNELAIQLYGMGFFNPQMADQALACLDMMDFDRKHFVMQKIAQNGGMYQMMMQMQQQMLMMAGELDGLKGTDMAQQMAMGMQASGMPMPNGMPNVEQTEALGGKEGSAESPHTKKARERVAQSTDPT